MDFIYGIYDLVIDGNILYTVLAILLIIKITIWMKITKSEFIIGITIVLCVFYFIIRLLRFG